MTKHETIELLLSSSPKAEAVYLALTVLGETRTSDIADYLGLDRPNTRKYLERLLSAGRVKIVTDDDRLPGPGRPSAVWAAV